MKEYLPQIIASAIVIVLLPISRYISFNIIRKSGTIIQMPENRILQVRQVVSILLNILFLFTIAIIWGVQPDNILLGLSSVFAVIGVAFFAQWSLLSNITAGIIMFFSAPFRVGDRIHLLDKDIPIIAVIENIQTFYTHIRTDEGELIVIPNSLFLQKIVSVIKN
ncbi:mechanosensitive ion channel domain-containing protein [Bacteroides reticulotermitis]|uniref:Small-conductance mechanosensitive channel n=2 Tax=Bacteroides reticulotermitis TaxID=1133319 RepID=W4UWK7_9BACE|nr:mechanosensitive ion channel domain-containing protein [Bacteroides reticulotermitis]MBB4042702.1 small-conductance mechanosensitive channel [Bacteroides reticulotermitis]GAE85331.1 small-conductance mechanosensitive channel [Bacteroides reticulotermitis JCM 10512]